MGRTEGPVQNPHPPATTWQWNNTESYSRMYGSKAIGRRRVRTGRLEPEVDGTLD